MENGNAGNEEIDFDCFDFQALRNFFAYEGNKK